MPDGAYLGCLGGFMRADGHTGTVEPGGTQQQLLVARSNLSSEVLFQGPLPHLEVVVTNGRYPHGSPKVLNKPRICFT